MTMTMRAKPPTQSMTIHFPPASKRTDPRTSFEAEFDITISGRRATHALQVLACVRRNPKLCAAEYGELTGLGRVEAARRLSDLKDDGKVRRLDERVKYGGTSQCVWEAVGELNQARLL